MRQRDIQCLEHIMDCCGDIEQCVVRFGNDFDTFMNDKAYHDLICFYLLQIGELSAHLSDELRIASSDAMNWAQIKGMRNVVAHHYGSIKLDIVWNTIAGDIPTLKAFCKEQLAKK